MGAIFRDWLERHEPPCSIYISGMRPINKSVYRITFQQHSKNMRVFRPSHPDACCLEVKSLLTLLVHKHAFLF